MSLSRLIPSGRSFWVYILECADGTYYTGWTVDIGARFQLHSIGKGAKYTRGRGPFKLAYLQEYTNRTSAMRRERRIKKMSRRQKKVLIAKQERELSPPDR